MFKKFIFWNYKETPEYIEAEALEAEIVDKCLDKLTIDLVLYSFVIGTICMWIYHVSSILINDFQTHFADSQIPELKFIVSLSLYFLKRPLRFFFLQFFY